jgi:hypothetical protein
VPFPRRIDGVVSRVDLAHGPRIDFEDRALLTIALIRSETIVSPRIR